MKFVDAILSNNSTDDHCREFVSQSGLEPLLSVLGLPNLPVDYPVTGAAQSVSAVCKSILVCFVLVFFFFFQKNDYICHLFNPLHF